MTVRLFSPQQTLSLSLDLRIVLSPDVLDFLFRVIMSLLLLYSSRRAEVTQLGEYLLRNVAFRRAIAHFLEKRGGGRVEKHQWWDGKIHRTVWKLSGRLLLRKLYILKQHKLWQPLQKSLFFECSTNRCCVLYTQHSCTNMKWLQAE